MDSISYALRRALTASLMMSVKDWYLRRTFWNHVLLSYRMGTCYYAVIRQKHPDGRRAMGWMG